MFRTDSEFRIPRNTRSVLTSKTSEDESEIIRKSSTVTTANSNYSLLSGCICLTAASSSLANSLRQSRAQRWPSVPHRQSPLSQASLAEDEHGPRFQNATRSTTATMATRSYQ